MLHYNSCRRFISAHSKVIVYRNVSAITSSSSSTANAKTIKFTQQQYPNTIVIAGATCVGKSDVALELCHQINQNYGRDACEIVIADAVQVYKHINIGCTKPSLAERAAVPHHVVDHRELGVDVTAMSAGDFVDEAMQSIREIHARGNTAVVVGGATMWVDWLLNGKPNAPKCPSGTSGDIRAEAAALLKPFQEKSMSKVTDKIKKQQIKTEAWKDAVNFVTAAVTANKGGHMSEAVRTDQLQVLQKLTANNYKYLSRSLEIAMTPADDRDSEGGKSVAKRGKYSGGLLQYVQNSRNLSNSTGNNSNGSDSDVHTQAMPVSLRCFFLTAPDRIGLYRQIDRRCLLMLKAGLLTEVTDLLLQGMLIADVDSLTYKVVGTAGSPLTGEIQSKEEAENAILLSQRKFSAAGTVAKSIGYRQSIDFLLSTLPSCSVGGAPMTDSATTDDGSNDVDADVDADVDLSWNDTDIAKLQHFISDFTASSRKYARYQLQYFRDDESFIWCQGLVGRASSSSSSSSLSLSVGRSNGVGNKTGGSVGTDNNNSSSSSNNNNNNSGSTTRSNKRQNTLSVVSELLHWCDLSTTDSATIAAGSNTSLDGDSIIQRQLQTGSLYHDLMQALPTSTVHNTDAGLLDICVLDLYTQAVKIAEESKAKANVRSEVSVLTPLRAVRMVVDKLKLIKEQEQQTSQLPHQIQAPEYALSALSPSLRAKEPSGTKSPLRTYISNYHDLRSDIKRAASWNARAAKAHISSRTNIKGKGKDKGKGKSQVAPLWVSTDEVMSVLPSLLLEINHCRRRLLDSGLFTKIN